MISVWQKFYKTLASIRTGIILLIITGVLSAIGTFVLQRPATDVDVLERTYSPTTLLWLDRFGLTDVFHAWWFALLLTLVSLSIIFASLERWPNAWRFYARPYRKPEAHFRAALPHHTEIPVASGKAGLDAAERGFASVGLKAERIVDADSISLYAERHRMSVLAVYIVHLSLLLIFFGGILDAIYGYRGYMPIIKGETNGQLEVRMRNKDVKHQLPFAIRCDDTGQENYADGTPKRWWSNLTVVENGKDVAHKMIVVNDPLLYKGIRFYQSSYGMTGKLDHVELQAMTPGMSPNAKPIRLGLNQTAQVDPETTVKLARFVPDFFIQDNEVFARSNELENPAFELVVTNKGKETKTWLMPRIANATDSKEIPYVFAVSDLKMLNYTGLQVSHEPGQWSVWAGVVLMAFGLAVAFYLVHMRFWAMAVNDPKKGWVIWVGGAFNKNKERFEERYNALVEAIQREVKAQDSIPPNAGETKSETTLASV